ncbi:NAD(P)-dependent oxidoreductase [Naasia sp. SYSU D00948]|uniref:NAD-dependent epimerase/dehydratase family protein n=1 Tax=Naasia sp. SYSU D00948 TaxID=2817379 RepID=UPI001B3055CA|nr:NAD(P)-dependent oxidoreductase [Naasia sp. SYSU D00948]
MTRVLVTGGSGRLGRSVVRVLAEAGHGVVSVDREALEGLPARQLQADLLAPGTASRLFREVRPEAVVHLAAIAVPFSAPEAETFITNTSLAYAVLEATLESGASSLLVASSPTVIGYNSPSGWSPAYLPLDERHPVAPWNAYALSKVAVEQLMAKAVRSDGHRARFGAFRPCYVISPEEWQGAPTQQGHTVLERLDDPSLSAVALFNYLDARDAGDFVRTWIENADRIPNGEVFFVGAPDSLVREPVGEALERLVPGVGGAGRHLAPDAAVFSSTHAEELLGWRARRTWRTELAATNTEASHG